MHLSPEIRRPLFTRSKRTRHRRNSEMLARLGILKRDKSVGGIGYAAAETRYLNWQPWLDFQFHRVALSSGRIFNTN